MDTTNKEDKMNPLRLILSIARRNPRPVRSPQPCSYDCYEENGCVVCSDWHEWEDDDYGLLGEWRRVSPADDRGPELQGDELDVHHEESAADEWLYYSTGESYCRCGAHVIGTPCYFPESADNGVPF